MRPTRSRNDWCKSWDERISLFGKKLTKLSRLIPPQENEDDSWTGPVDKDGFPVGRTPDDKKIEALPPVDHSQIEVRNGERWMRQA